MHSLTNILIKDNISISKEKSINDTIEVMYSNGEGCVVILDNNKAIGILTERDIVSFINEYIDMDQPVLEVIKKDLITLSIKRSLEYALHVLIDNNIRRLIVVDSDGYFIGIVTQEMIVNNLEEEVYRVNLKVAEVLSSSAKDIITLKTDSILKDAITLMHSKHIGAVLISQDKNIIGIVTERDIVRFMSNKTALTTPITKVMSSPVLCVGLQDNIKYIINMMHQNTIRRVVVNDAQGNAVGVIGTRDIIKNIKGNYGLFVENKLKYTKQALNTIDEVIFELYSENDTLLIQWGNEIAVKRYGRSIIDQNITKLIDKITWSKIIAILKKDGKIDNYKITIKNKQYLLSCTHYYINTYTKAFFIICKDVTEYELQLISLNKNLDIRVKEEVAKNKRQEEQLFAQSRLAQMGEMISMIAHQWRQPLGAISTTAINLKLKLQLEAFDLETKKGINEASVYFLARLEDIENLVMNLTTTIDDFRNFYKPNKKAINATLQQVIKKSLNIIKASLINDNIEVIEEYNDEKEVQLYESEMMQVVLNILKNSQDNFKERDIKNPYIKISTDNGMLSISDNGLGISEDIIDKVFDPYFSTKSEKNGTGLGLHMSKTIVQEHHQGHLNVQNTDDGVCFIIDLRKKD